MMRPSIQDRLNKSTWSKASSRRWSDYVEDFTDPGERAALDGIRDEVRGAPILDLGVGTGRTIPLLRPLTADYRAIDYLPAMVRDARARHPGVRIDLGDARTLDAVPERHFGLVHFSFNGIDAVGSGGRRSVFNAVRRVLRPGGIFLFSTLNLEGPAYRERPWHMHWNLPRDPVPAVVRAARTGISTSVELWNWIRLQGATERAAGYAIAPLRAHNYGVLVHFTSLSRQLDELRSAAFAHEVEVLDNVRGERISPDADVSHVAWFHIIARRPL